jgi:hypothetical protein
VINTEIQFLQQSVLRGPGFTFNTTTREFIREGEVTILDKPDATALRFFMEKAGEFVSTSEFARVLGEIGCAVNPVSMFTRIQKRAEPDIPRNPRGRPLGEYKHFRREKFSSNGFRKEGFRYVPELESKK